MGTSSQELISQGFLAIARELQDQRAIAERTHALVSALCVKQGITERDVERVESLQRDQGKSLSALELQLYAVSNAE